jgi:asparagine N-glycosylation enzyme membrane subunit Stt3
MKLALALVILVVVVLCIAGSLRRALTVATGYGIYIFLGQLYDYVLWPIVQGYHGMTGAVAMSLGAVAINFGVLHAYQRMGIDWLGVGVLQNLQARIRTFANRLPALPARLLQSLLRLPRSKPLAFVALSSLTDSFLTTAYLRKGRFGPLEKRDLAIFAGSSVLSCAAWTLVNEGALGVLRKAWGNM